MRVVTRTARRRRPLWRRLRRRRTLQGRPPRLYTAPSNVFSLQPFTPASSRLMLRLSWPVARYLSSQCRFRSRSPDIIPGSLRHLDVVACPSPRALHPSLHPHSSPSPWNCNRHLSPSLLLRSTPSPRFVTLTSSMRSTHHLTLYECRHPPHAPGLRIYVSSARLGSLIRYFPPKFFTPIFAPNFEPNSSLIFALFPPNLCLI